LIKIAFGMIVFEGDYVLRECLQQVYPHASQILIAEGPVKYWQEKGRTTSLDNTNKILKDFPDPENKITIVHGQFSEKDEQCNSYMSCLNSDIDYLWNLDSDEIYKSKDIERTIEFLEKEEPTSVGVRSLSFYGGFDNFLTGFELNRDNFLRIFRVTEGSKWLTHRPPTIRYPRGSNIIKKHIDSNKFYHLTGVQMYHYSYVFPNQVKNKIEYYKAKVSRHKCIDDYYSRIYLPWILGEEFDRFQLEKEFQGVHEFKPEFRGPCYTEPFQGEHPKAVENNLEKLNNRIKKELKQ
tara:strand:- start:654 stop:1535 length:882 start_codon:yes stop_codon:yes gene_type:complete